MDLLFASGLLHEQCHQPWGRHGASSTIPTVNSFIPPGLRKRCSSFQAPAAQCCARGPPVSPMPRSPEQVVQQRCWAGAVPWGSHFSQGSLSPEHSLQQLPQPLLPQGCCELWQLWFQEVLNATGAAGALGKGSFQTAITVYSLILLCAGAGGSVTWVTSGVYFIYFQNSVWPRAFCTKCYKRNNKTKLKNMSCLKINWPESSRSCWQ